MSAGLWSREDAFGSNWTPCPILEPGRISEDVQGRDSVLKMPGRGGREQGLLEFSALSSSATHIPFPFAGLLFVNLSETTAGLGEFLAVFKQEAPAALSVAQFCRNSVHPIPCTSPGTFSRPHKMGTMGTHFQRLRVTAICTRASTLDPDNSFFSELSLGCPCPDTSVPFLCPPALPVPPEFLMSAKHLLQHLFSVREFLGSIHSTRSGEGRNLILSA